MNINRSLFGIYHPLHKTCQLLADITSIAIAFYVAALLRLGSPPNFLSIEYLGVNVIIVFTLFISSAYMSSDIGSPPKLPLKTFFATIASAVPTLFFIYLLGPERFTSLFGRGVYPFALLILGTLAIGSRYVLNLLFKDQARRRNVLMVGNIEFQNTLAPYIQKMARADIELVPSIQSADQKLVVYAAIIVLPGHVLDDQDQDELINLRLSGTPIFSLSDFIESHLFLIPVHQVDNNWFIQAQGFAMLHSSVTTRLKRGVDILAAISLLVFTLPITVLTWIVITLTSRGGAIFSQTRVGLNGSEFKLHKFRTMVSDAEVDGAQWASDNDPRITRVGRFLRKSRIDELPQCWNILRGEMSIIGPRPERPEFTNTLKEEIPYYDLRHIVKPGLSGWAQVMYPYGASKEDALHKLQYDLFYIKNQSLLLDLNILIRTVLVTLHRQGR